MKFLATLLLSLNLLTAYEGGNYLDDPDLREIAIEFMEENADLMKDLLDESYAETMHALSEYRKGKACDCHNAHLNTAIEKILPLLEQGHIKKGALD